VHQTTDLGDGYLGSGTVLRKAIKKYGADFFRKEILYVFDNAEEMFAKEQELVTEDVISDPMSYNLDCGGKGGWDFVNRSGRNLYGQNLENLAAARHKGAAALLKLRQNAAYDEQYRKRVSSGVAEHYRKHGSVWLGRIHKEATKVKIGQANSVAQKGERNSQFGTCWIHRNGKNKKVPKGELPVYIEQGWTAGRKLKRITECLNTALIQVKRVP